MPSKPHPTVCMKPKTVGLFFLRCGLLETVDKPRFHRPWNRATGSRFRTVHDGLFTVWRQKCTCKSVPAITWLLVSRRRVGAVCHTSYQVHIRNVAHILFFYFPAQLVRDFTLSDLLDRPWSQVSSLPPGTCLQFLSRIGFSIPTAHRFLLNVANSRSRAFR